MVDPQIVASFHAMWDTFPERARLIQKDRTVLAVNKAAAEQGMQIGVRCIDTPPKEGHMGCLANLALRERQGKYQLTADRKRLRFWIPVDGCDNIFVHFSIPVEDFLK